MFNSLSFKHTPAVSASALTPGPVNHEEVWDRAAVNHVDVWDRADKPHSDVTRELPPPAIAQNWYWDLSRIVQFQMFSFLKLLLFPDYFRDSPEQSEHSSCAKDAFLELPVTRYAN